jgi:hypothetical protein
LEFCAVAFGCSIIALNRPADGLVTYYKTLGFTQVVIKKGKIQRLEQQLGANPKPPSVRAAQ